MTLKILASTLIVVWFSGDFVMEIFTREGRIAAFVILVLVLLAIWL